MTNTFREHPHRAVLDPRPLRHLIQVMSSHDLTNKKTITKTNTKTKIMTKTLREHPQRAIIETCDLRLDT